MVVSLRRGTVIISVFKTKEFAHFAEMAKVEPKETKVIREGAGVSQGAFAEHLSVTVGLVSKWERGDKRPSKMALKVLTLVKTKGLDVIA